MSIRTFLIHLLGGVTCEEYQANQSNSYQSGCLTVILNVYDYANSLNGMPADDWCKTLYSYLTERKKMLSENMTGNTIP